MALPTQPVTLTVDQVEELNRQLSTMRHDINNSLSLVVASMELIQRRPELAERMLATLAEQPARISASLKLFSQEFERAFGIARH
jgi:hypothetical protein